MRIDNWFPTPVGVAVNKDDCNLSDHCIELMSKVGGGGDNWIGRPYTTMGTDYDILEDEKFSGLNSWITKNVNEFASSCGWANVVPKVGWFNVYKKGDYQESHLHANHHFSCVYFLDAKDDDARLIFMRTPLPSIEHKVVKKNPINYNLSWYEPHKGLLLIFKSDTMHMVEQKKTDGIRISLSYNFCEEN